MPEYDAIVVGAGPNGLAAAIAMARARRRVLVLEANQTVGGGTRSAALTLPGFVHDLGSAVHPLGIGSPFLRTLPLDRYGLQWIHPPIPLAHPFDDGTAALLKRSLIETADLLGRDGPAYRLLMGTVVRNWEQLTPAILGPLRVPRHPLALAGFGARAIWPASLLARTLFREQKARGLFAGLAAHAALPLDWPATSAVGLVLGALAHVVGWPIPRGGAQSIADAMTAYLRDLGGEVVVGQRVAHLDDLPPSRTVLCDVTPRQLLALAGDRLTPAYRRALARYQYGVGSFKLDWALDGPIPWRATECLQAGTVHLGPTLDEIVASERAPWSGQAPAHPYVLLSQPTLFDPSRAPAGKHVAWAYCHLPNGSPESMTDRIEAQLERFAPGFRARVLARHVMDPTALEQSNANLVGGDISGGAATLGQLFFRPTVSLTPYATSAEGLYICSSSTPPGPGVHGLCGYHAARAALHYLAL